MYPVSEVLVNGLRTLEVVASENVVVPPLVGGERNEDKDIEAGPDPDEPELLLGDDGRELLYPYPVVLPYPYPVVPVYPYPVVLVLSRLGVDLLPET
jgi:hypothetical protein